MMKKLVKRNLMQQNTIQYYVNQCDYACMSCACTFEAARQDKKIGRYDAGYVLHIEPGK